MMRMLCLVLAVAALLSPAWEARSLDEAPLAVTSVYSAFNQTEITVRFSEPVNFTAEEPENYALDRGVDILAVNRLNERSVLLLTTPLVSGALYTLTINRVANAVSGTPIAADTTVSFTALPPAEYVATFDSGSPARGQVFGTASISATDGVGGTGSLKLTIATNDQNGSFLADTTNGLTAVAGFIATFEARVGGGTPIPSDGFSFNFAPDLPQGIYTQGEEGAGTGLTVAFDAHDETGTNGPAIDIKFGGQTVASRQVDFLTTGDEYVDVLIRVDPDGTLDLVYNGHPVYSQLLVYTNKIAGRFGLGARTGAQHANHWIDDLQIAVATSVCSALQISQTETNNLISWDGACILQRAEEVTGPYLDVPDDPDSPYVVPEGDTRGFYRLRDR